MTWNYIFAFVLRNILTLTTLTICNYIYSIEFFSSFSLFFIRQTFLSIGVFLLDCYKTEFGILSKESACIDAVVLGEYPILRFRVWIGFFSIVTVIALSLCEFKEGLPLWVEILFQFSGLCGFAFIVLSIFRLGIIFSNPSLTDYFDIRKSVKHHGLRSFSTASKVFHTCKQCGPFVLALAVGCDIVGTRFINSDPGARGYLENHASKHLTEYGLMARNKPLYNGATHLLDYAPHERPKIIDEKGYVKGHLLQEAYDRNPRVRPPEGFITVDMNHHHHHHLGGGKGPLPASDGVKSFLVGKK